MCITQALLCLTQFSVLFCTHTYFHCYFCYIIIVVCIIVVCIVVAVCVIIVVCIVVVVCVIVVIIICIYNNIFLLLLSLVLALYYYCICTYNTVC